jgi:hypothetical protein
MHDALDPVCFDGMEEILQHRDITAYHYGTFGNILNGLSIGLGIEEYDPFASVEQATSEMGTNKPRTTSNHNGHRCSPSWL